MEIYKIYAKYAPFVVIPGNGVENRFYLGGPDEDFRFVTTDGVICKAEFQATYNNQDGRYDYNLDDYCKRKFGICFQAIRSMWISRIGELDYYWHIIKLIKS